VGIREEITTNPSMLCRSVDITSLLFPKEVLQSRKLFLGDNHPETLPSMSDLAYSWSPKAKQECICTQEFPDQFHSNNHSYIRACIIESQNKNNLLSHCVFTAPIDALLDLFPPTTAGILRTETSMVGFLPVSIGTSWNSSAARTRGTVPFPALGDHTGWSIVNSTGPTPALNPTRSGALSAMWRSTGRIALGSYTSIPEISRHSSATAVVTGQGS